MREFGSLNHSPGNRVLNYSAITSSLNDQNSTSIVEGCRHIHVTVSVHIRRNSTDSNCNLHFPHNSFSSTVVAYPVLRYKCLFTSSPVQLRRYWAFLYIPCWLTNRFVQIQSELSSLAERRSSFTVFFSLDCYFLSSTLPLAIYSNLPLLTFDLVFR